MPKIETWGKLPHGIRQHLIDRMRDQAISIETSISFASGLIRRRKCPRVIGTENRNSALFLTTGATGSADPYDTTLEADCQSAAD
jgi:hypothetical protein